MGRAVVPGAQSCVTQHPRTVLTTALNFRIIFLREPLILNCASSRYSGANIRFFATAAKLCLHLEPWAVEDGTFFVFDADGQILDLATDGMRVQLVETGQGTRSDLLALLAEFLSELETAREIELFLVGLKLIDTKT
jgi:hypothetical protein